MLTYTEKKYQRGFTLIEGLVSLAIFSLMTLTFYTLYAVAIQRIDNARMQQQAVGIATQKMEALRNLPYDDVAVSGGVPAGDIDPDEIVQLNNRSYHVRTQIGYRDDPEDGTLGGSPDDIDPNDYKFVRITVSWGDEGSSETIQLVSRFVPPGIENSIGGGILSLNSIDFSGTPVPSVSVSVINNNVLPAINLSDTTDADGNVKIIGVPADDEYEIVFSKDGYETVQTYPPPPGTSFVPIDVHAVVSDGDISQKSMIINQLSDVEILTKDPFGDTISGLDVSLKGGRRLDIGEVDPVYNYEQTHTTDGDGKINLNEVSGGTYTVATSDWEVGQYKLWKFIAGGGEDRNSLEVPHGQLMDAELVLMDTAVDSLFILVADAGTGEPIESASVRVSNVSLGYDETLTTGEYGAVYFPLDEVAPLQNGETYEIEVSATGYQNNNKTSDIINGWTETPFNLLPQ